MAVVSSRAHNIPLEFPDSFQIFAKVFPSDTKLDIVSATHNSIHGNSTSIF